MDALADAPPQLQNIPEETIGRPLAHLKLQGRRHCRLGAALLRGTDGPVLSKADVRTMHTQICLDLPFDLQHREQVLLPMLAYRAAPEDEVEHLSDSLTGMYRALYRLCEPLGHGLDALLHRRGGTIELRGDAVRFADLTDRTFALEASVLLPLARVRLAPEDLRQLAAALRSNRRLKAEARKAR